MPERNPHCRETLRILYFSAGHCLANRARHLIIVREPGLDHEHVAVKRERLGSGCRVRVAGLAVDVEIDEHRGFHFHRLPAKHIWLVTPLLHCIHGGAHQHGMALDDLK